MDLKYLKEQLAVREQEIKDGKNLATSNPVYVVLDLIKQISYGHDGYISCVTNHHGKDPEYGYIDRGSDEPEFCQNNIGMDDYEEVTRFWTDKVVAFFITSKAAYDYLKYQAHNMNDPYVYVFHSGYGNKQMDKLLKGC